ncbi:phosphatase PAP2 family protein [Nocardia pseudobrasiliensis]|uniref:Undecaprenyl-diphosphatase n=1 Tax=Nocardia pseudobrasiliensis TaxID=45979 RepID=A0A370HPI1_9NOCA|nr:phosphatase PAP2 family protein [Nocardia pseudobrasiliensis]RDI60486.1 undecaprenyl-diphosphatase [Nocardia pseudobrasiliensis]
MCAAAVGLIATTLIAWATTSRIFDALDQKVFRYINSWPDNLYRPLWLVQLVGVLGAPAVIAVAAAATRRFRLAVALILLIPAKLLVEFDILKVLVQHSRPGATVPDAILRNVPPTGLSFPSGHAVILFGIATLVSPYLDRGWRCVVFTIAALAATARIYLGAHGPLDVLGGAAVGITLGALLTLVLGQPHRPASTGTMPSSPRV